MDVIAARATAPQQRAILAHYERVAPLIALNFPLIPLVFEYHPHGLGTEPTYSNLHGHQIPHTVRRVPVETSTHFHIYPGCAVNTILTYVHAYADGVHSWTPTPCDPDAVGFARMHLKPVCGGTQTQLRDALVTLRDVLRAHRFQAIPIFEGNDAALFIPLADAPPYEPSAPGSKPSAPKRSPKHRNSSSPTKSAAYPSPSRASKSPSPTTPPARTPASPTRSPAARNSRCARPSTGTSSTRCTTANTRPTTPKNASPPKATSSRTSPAS
jgi:hypothetical protein